VVAAFGRSVAISGLTHHIEPRAHHRHIAAISRCFTAGAKIGQNQAFLRRKEGRVEHFFSSGAAAFFNLFFFHFWQAAKPVIDICFDWQKYQNIKPSSFNNQAVSYVFGTVCKRIVQSLFRSKERKNKLNDRNKLLWGSDAYPIIQSKVLTKDETEEKKE